jgi:hypothetical protein
MRPDLMRTELIDVMAGERARTIATAPDVIQPILDPTDPRCARRPMTVPPRRMRTPLSARERRPGSPGPRWRRPPHSLQ